MVRFTIDGIFKYFLFIHLHLLEVIIFVTLSYFLVIEFLEPWIIDHLELNFKCDLLWAYYFVMPLILTIVFAFAVIYDDSLCKKKLLKFKGVTSLFRL